MGGVGDSGDHRQSSKLGNLILGLKTRMEAQPPDCQPQEYGLTNSELEICQSTFFLEV